MTTALWTAYEAAAATGGALCARGGDPDRWIAEEWTAKGVSIDTRTLKPGEIFVALKDARDGHEFVPTAFERGAAAALVARAPSSAPDGAPLLIVDDTLDGLRRLAAAARLRNFGKRIAVTGSAGKTSVKEMLRTALGAVGQVHAADKSFNNHWGVPLTLAALPMHAEFGVFEIGMNHAGEITPLTRLVAPHVAVVTTVAAAHLEFFNSVEEIAEAKAEIFLGLAPGGVAVLPQDNAYFQLLRERAEAAGAGTFRTFGEAADADYRLLDYASDGDRGAQIVVATPTQELSLSLGAPGKHQAINALAVIAAAEAVGVDPATAGRALAGHGAPSGRGERRRLRVAGREILVIDESYNANPASVAAALALLGEATPTGDGRRIAVLGDMLELGPEGEALHADLAQNVTAAGVNRLYAAGPLMRRLWDAAPETIRAAAGASASEIAAKLLDDLRDGDIILVKGSNASKVSDLISFLENRRETG
ncbi:MAG: UDP-N-acetylmuramoyl-tripeptide--D-alanyl-D-alanine ligase, partial [Pseudomonadota bacterium]